MWVFNEPAVRCVFRCCSTVCWGDLNRQSKDNRKEKKHQPPALCTTWQIKKLLLLTRWSRVPVALLSVDLTLIKSALRSQKKPNIQENVFLNLLLQFLLMPQTSLSRLIKQPGLPGYCLCIWWTGLCQLSTCPPNNTTTPLLPNKALVPTVWCPAGPTSAGLCSGWSRRTVTLHHPLAPTQHHHTHIYASIVP